MPTEPTEAQKPPWWVDLIKTVGISTALLIAFCYGAVQAAKWYAEQVILPATKDAHTLSVKQQEFIDVQARERAEDRAQMRGQAEHALQMLRVSTDIENTTKDTNAIVKLSATQAKADADKQRAETARLLEVLETIAENTTPETQHPKQ